MTRPLLLSPSAVLGGAERAFASLATGLPARHFRPVVALLQDGPIAEWLAEADCEVALCPDPDPDEAIHWVEELASASEAEIVVSNKRKGHEVGAPAADANGLPSIWWQQDVPKNPGRESHAVSLPVTAIVCSSDHALAAQRRFTPNARIERIHLGVPVAKVALRRGSGGPIRAELGWQSNPVVGMVGRLDPAKGQHDFLRAAAAVAERRPDVRFVLVGGAIVGHEGSYPDDLRTLTDDLGLADRVHFAEHQSDVYPWFDALDVVVHASHFEAFGLVLVEAMALGKPVVTTVPGDPAGIVEDGVSGLRVPVESPDALAEAVGRLLDDRSYAAALGRAGEQRAPLFSEDLMVDRFAELIRDVLARSRSAAG
jgi:glycosyltransferase involved in cell wall biosynthesis